MFEVYSKLIQLIIIIIKKKHAHTNTFTKQLPATIMFLCEPPAPLALVGALVVRRRQPVPKAGLEKS